MQDDSPKLVYTWDFYAKRVIRTDVLLGDVPQQVATAAQRYATGDKRGSSLLSHHYGQQYARKLGLVSNTQGGATTEGELVLTESDLAALGLSSRPTKEPKHAPASKDTGSYFAHTVQVWPFDRLSEVREKIYVATGIPPYRQHIFCDTTDYVMYRVMLHGLYNVDIRDTASSMMVGGVPVDKYMVNNKEAIRIEAFDVFRTADTLHWPLMVVDLGSIIRHNQVALQDSMKDAYQRQLIYWGFVAKFWPMFCFQCFVDYFDNEDDLLLKYPGFYKPLSTLIPLIKKETYLLRSLPPPGAPRTLPMTVTKAHAFIKYPLQPVSLRAMFDKFTLSKRCPAMHLHAEHQGCRYLIKKTYMTQPAQFPAVKYTRRDSYLIIALTVDRATQTWLKVHSNGSCSIHCEWHEDKQMQIEGIQEFMIGLNPVIELINAAGAKIEPITKHNLQFGSMTCSVYWKRTMHTKAFKLVADSWADYITAGILAYKGAGTDKLEYVFMKFIHVFDPTVVEKILRASNNIILSNFYAYLSTEAIQTKWMQHYEGRKMTMVHRATDVRFDVQDIHADEFANFYRCLVSFCKQAERIMTTQSIAKSPSTQKLRALKEQDPVLFNFAAVERNVKSVNTYSVACQKPMQPIIHDKEVPKSTKYWNFSQNKPVYYTCPNPKYPRFGFIKDIHPDHLCVPCCYKETSDMSDKKTQRVAYCLKNKCAPGATPSAILVHVLDYGKLAEPGRHTKLPLSLRKLLGKGGSSYTLLGLPRDISGLHGVSAQMLFAITTALGSTIEDTLRSWIGMLPAAFPMLLQGRILDAFASKEALSADLAAISQGKMLANHTFAAWDKLFIDLAGFASNLVVLQCDDPLGNDQVVLCLRAGQHILPDTKLCVCLQQRKYLYLLCRDTQTLFQDDECTALFGKMANFAPTKETQWRNVDLALVLSLGCKITAAYINRQGSCYAVLCELDGRVVYCPVMYEKLPVDTQYTIMRTAYIGEPVVERETARWFVGRLQEQINVMTQQGTPYAECPLVERAVGFLCNNKGYIYCANVTNAWDPKQLTRAILANEAPTEDPTSRVADCMYTVYQYDMFLRETVRFLSHNTNVEVRSELIKLLQNTKKVDVGFRGALKELLRAYPRDIKDVWLIIDNHVRTTGSGDLTQVDFGPALSRVRFAFDRDLVGKINAMSIDEAKKTLLDLTKQYIIEQPVAQIKEFPNIRSCCADYGQRPDFCKGDKLIISGDLSTFCELAVGDLRNPIISRYLFDTTEVVVTSYFDFIVRPEETIEVILLGV